MKRTEKKTLHKSYVWLCIITLLICTCTPMPENCGNYISAEAGEQCPGDPGGVDVGSLSIGGQTYRTVIIGGKRWMAENLNYKTNDSWCYDNNASYCATYGRLYTWNAAVSACQAIGDGWHLPSPTEWDNLVEAAGGSGEAGGKLKSKIGWEESFGRGNGTDDFGFSALPGGLRHITDGYFVGVGSVGVWWSAKEHGSDFERWWNVQNSDDRMGKNYNYGGKEYAHSARCAKDM